MTYDGELDIAIGLSARSKVWSNKKLKWSELVSRLGEENKTTETFKEFVSASKEDQLKIKELLRRVQDGTVQEVIMATNPTVEAKRPPCTFRAC